MMECGATVADRIASQHDGMCKTAGELSLSVLLPVVSSEIAPACTSGAPGNHTRSVPMVGPQYREAGDTTGSDSAYDWDLTARANAGNAAVPAQANKAIEQSGKRVRVHSAHRSCADKVPKIKHRKKKRTEPGVKARQAWRRSMGARPRLLQTAEWMAHGARSTELLRLA